MQGLDISEDMLDVAREREVEGDLCLHDLGHGLPLRPGSFDGAISISAVQWLCNAVSALLCCCKMKPADMPLKQSWFFVVMLTYCNCMHLLQVKDFAE